MDDTFINLLFIDDTTAVFVIHNFSFFHSINIYGIVFRFLFLRNYFFNHWFWFLYWNRSGFFCAFSIIFSGSGREIFILTIIKLRSWLSSSSSSSNFTSGLINIFFEKFILSSAWNSIFLWLVGSSLFGFLDSSFNDSFTSTDHVSFLVEDVFFDFFFNFFFLFFLFGAIIEGDSVTIFFDFVDDLQ